MVRIFLWWLIVVVGVMACVEGGNYDVTYDRRSLIINGQRKLLISGSIHYPRSVPAMWPGLIQTAKEGGLNVIDTYVFWNGHELSPDNYYFEGRYDLVKFVKTVQQASMYLTLRIGPYICSEWNYGGIPVWLHYVPGTVFRTDNEPFKHYMQKFMTYIVDQMKQENLFASQGGPIILAQVENEYGGYENSYGDAGKRYALWAAKMAVSLNTGVPWIMCNQYDDALNYVIDTCNSHYCDQFTPKSPNSPKLWTENWPGWHTYFGGTTPHRPAEDIAFSVARFFQKGGSLQNYYMYHGGTNFDRTAGGPLVTTSYDYDAPIDEYGLIRLPKWAHLRDLHNTIQVCEHALLNGERTSIKSGSFEADVFEEPSGACAAFLSNMDNKTDMIVTFRNVSYNLPAWSVSILPDCKNVAFNTVKVGSQTSVVRMVPEKLKLSIALPDKDLKSKWGVFVEKIGLWGNADFSQIGFADHINTTKDITDYLWYTTSLYLKEDDEILKDCRPLLIVESKDHALHAFVNQKFKELWTPITLKAGNNEIAILSTTVGLQHAALYKYEWIGAGLKSVRIKGCTNRTIDLSDYTWTYKLQGLFTGICKGKENVFTENHLSFSQGFVAPKATLVGDLKIGLEGEELGIYKPDNFSNLKWVAPSELHKQQPLTWYKVVVDAPPGNEPIGLDMINMGKGFAWLNGEAIGRYWLSKSPNDKCVDKCDYRGVFTYYKCETSCGEPTQRWYHVPRSWFKPTGNVLVILEETGGDPTQIRFSRRKISGFA